MRQPVYQVCYTRYHVSFYLWLIESVLKHCKVPKYYDQDWRLETGQWEGLNISLGKKLFCNKRGTLEIGVFVAMANDLLIILRGRSLQAVINGNEAEMDQTGLEVEGKRNGGNSALSNLKDTAILYDLLNLLLCLKSLENSIELNIASASFRFSFSARCNPPE